MRGEANRSGLFKNITRNRFIRPRVSSARFMESNNAALDIHASPESTIAVILDPDEAPQEGGPGTEARRTCRLQTVGWRATWQVSPLPPGTARLQAATLSTAWSGAFGTARLLGKTLGTARLLGETPDSAETPALGTARLPGETLGSAGTLGFAPDTARGTLGTAQQGALGTARLQGGTLQGALGTARLQGGTLDTARMQGTHDTARLGTLGTARLQGGTLGTPRLQGGTLGTALLHGNTWHCTAAQWRNTWHCTAARGYTRHCTVARLFLILTPST